jgi:hypothetical protein
LPAAKIRCAIAHPSRGPAALVLAATVAVAGCDFSSPERPASTSQRAPAPAAATSEESPRLPDGRYGVQSVSYDDASGHYRVFLREAPAGSAPIYESGDVRMARLDDTQVAAGEKNALEVKGNEATLWLLPDAQIAYTHNVTEEQTNPQTGEREVVVVRQESSFWTPFLGSMAGAAVGNMLFAPRYYYPPPYSGGRLSGFGGYGATRDLAAQSFSTQHGRLPQPAKLRTSGYTSKVAGDRSLRSSGTGAGSSRFSQPSSSRGFGKSFGSKPVKPRSSFGFGRRR